ncbi:DUF2752 domain-containing protein [Polaribacter sp. SA4-12]|uniref:DUF2752 domain-containing protein n=1 Tax=Polaribacter sp. SA4-12 TaxID=1312072 RepID=UPI003FA7579D
MLLIRGEFLLAYKMYPAIYTLLLFGFFLLINRKLKLKNSRKIIVTFAIINVLIIIVSYYIKMKPIFTI